MEYGSNRCNRAARCMVKLSSKTIKIATETIGIGAASVAIAVASAGLTTAAQGMQPSSNSESVRLIDTTVTGGAVTPGNADPNAFSRKGTMQINSRPTPESGVYSAEGNDVVPIKQRDSATDRPQSVPATFPYWSCAAPGLWAAQCRVEGAWNQQSAK